MRIAITGGSGYLGSALGSVLPPSCDILDPVAPRFSLKPGQRHIPLDLANRGEAKKHLRNYDRIIHLAGLVGFPACQNSPTKAFASNLITTENLIAETEPSVPILMASTVSIYGAGSEVVTEKSPLRATSIYAKTKIAAEAILRRRKNSIILRLSSAFGIAKAMRHDLLIHDFCKRATLNEKLEIYEGNFPRAFCHVEDLARAILFFTTHFNRFKDETFNIGSSECEKSKLDIVQMITATIPVLFEERSHLKDPEARLFHVSFEKLKATGFTCTHSIASTIPTLLQHYRQEIYKGEFTDKVQNSRFKAL